MSEVGLAIFAELGRRPLPKSSAVAAFAWLLIAPNENGAAATSRRLSKVRTGHFDS